MWSAASNSFIFQELRANRKRTCITVVILGIALFAYFLTYAAFANVTHNKPTLKMLHLVFRHGAKTPTGSYPTDPYSSKVWPEGNGALTNQGKMQLFKLGKTIRNLYGHFIGEHYTHNEVSIASSYSPRCQMSAMTFLASLFPPKGDQIWNDELLWQPIPVNPIPRDVDNLIAAKAYCEAFNEEKLKSDDELRRELSDVQVELFHYLSKYTGQFINNISQVENLYFTLLTQKENGLKIPDWTNDVFPEPMASVAALNLASYTRTNKLKKLQAGPMLNEWLNHLSEQNQIKLYIYSGHDLTIVNLMRTLGFDYMLLPEYGASLIIEYHRDIESKEFVKVLYVNSSMSANPNDLKLPGCDEECPLNKFSELVRPFILKNWKEECTVPK